MCVWNEFGPWFHRTHSLAPGTRGGRRREQSPRRRLARARRGAPQAMWAGPRAPRARPLPAAVARRYPRYVCAWGARPALGVLARGARDRARWPSPRAPLPARRCRLPPPARSSRAALPCGAACRRLPARCVPLRRAPPPAAACLLPRARAPAFAALPSCPSCRFPPLPPARGASAVGRFLPPSPPSPPAGTDSLAVLPGSKSARTPFRYSACDYGT